MLKLIINGTDAFVSNAQDVSHYLSYVLNSEKFIDMRFEGIAYTKEDVEQLRCDEQEQLLRYAFAETKSEAKRLAKNIVPKIGSLRPIDQDKQLMAWLKKCTGLPGEDKIPAFLNKLCVIRRSGRDFYVPFLSHVLLSDPLEFLDALFVVSTIEEASRLESLRVPDVLMPIMDVKDAVNGRGEVLSTLVFGDCTWSRGTGLHDLQGTDGGWHCKELVSGYAVRLGRSAYTTSALCEKMTALTKCDSWVSVGKCDVRSGLTKGVIDANRELLALNGVSNVEETLQREMLLAEVDTQGVIFYKGNTCYVRKMRDCVCETSTKGDYRISPRRKLVNDERTNDDDRDNQSLD